MKIRFSIFVIFVSNFLLISCSENKLSSAPVSGYPAPRLIKKVELEESWKQRADRLLVERTEPALEKPVTQLAQRPVKKTARKISSSHKKTRKNLVALNSKVFVGKKALPVW